MARKFLFSEKPDTRILNVREAGRLGGLALLKKKGLAHFAHIGRLGQSAMRQKHAGMASTWGRKGGRPRKPSLDEITGESGE